MMRKPFLLFILFLLFALSSILVSAHAEHPELHGEASATGPTHSLNHAPGRLLVKFRAGTGPVSSVDGACHTGQASLDRLLATHQIQSARPLFAGAAGLEQIYLLHMAADHSVAEAVQALAADPDVEWAEPDYLAYPADTAPNDLLFADQWGLAKIQAPAAWDVVTGSPAVAIAIVDSGVDFTHPDLANKLWLNPGEIAGNGLDDDNNGYVDDINGWDFVTGDNAPDDDHGHGTQVAGVAAAASNNGIGIAAVCWGCKVMPVKVMQASGVANYSDIAAGVLYAAQKGARVINLSLGGYSDSYALKTAVQTAAETYGAVIVAGAGNDDLNTLFYPAAYEPVLAVAGTEQADAKASLSNYGTWVDVSAPAVAITTTFMGGDYGAVDGTSYDAPFAAGLAGLLRSQNPTWSADMVRAQIIHTADDIDGLNPGFEGLLGHGRINAAAAVTTLAQPLLIAQGYAVDGVAGGRPEPGSTVDLDVTLYNDWADARGVQVALASGDPYVTIVAGSASFGDILAYGSGTNLTPLRFSVAASAPYGHDMNLTLHVTAGGGYAIDIPLTIQTASSVVYPPATITTQTWTNDRIYVINKETGIPSGATLTVEPGTEIRFDAGYSLSVAGTLIADGTEAQPIVFTSNATDPAAGDWGQIRFLNSSVDATFDGEGNYAGGSILRHTVIEYGQGVDLWLAAPYISNNLFQHIATNHGDGLLTQGETLRIEGNTFLGTGIKIIASAGTIAGNVIRESQGPGIAAERTALTTMAAGDSLTITANTVSNNAGGIWVQVLIPEWSMSVTGNLIAHNDGHGLWISDGAPAVASNTILYNGDSGVYIEAGTPTLRNNNLIPSAGKYALQNAASNSVDAAGNWWGTVDETAIQATIYDGLDEFGLGLVDYGSYMSGPEQTAPAYVTNVQISPDTTLGIQTATFEVAFSRPMSQAVQPRLSFRLAKHGTWTVHDKTNSDLPDNEVSAISVDLDESLWFGTLGGGVAHFDSTNWTIYNTSNSGLPHNDVTAIAADPDGSHWFGTFGGGVARFDGTSWTVYDTSNSGLPRNEVYTIAIDPDGSHWFGTQAGGAAHFDGINWTVYTTENSGLPYNIVYAIATDPDSSHWFGTWEGVAEFDGANWIVYDTDNSGLPDHMVNVITTDPDGSHWFGTGNAGVAYFDGVHWTVYNHDNSGMPGVDLRAIIRDPDGSHWFGTYIGGAAHFDGTRWIVYETSNSGLPSDIVYALASDPDGSHWFGTGAGVAVLWNAPTYVIESNHQWIDDLTYKATYDITSLISRGDYLVHVAVGSGTDGIEIIPSFGYTFTVDYAGAIGDTTPPPVPAVEACAGTDVGTVSASWTADDPESDITLYRYAIGTTPGGTEVINWTTTADASFLRASLGLAPGQTIYVAVQARNEGGLWSAAGIPDGILAGSGTCATNTRHIYLPLLVRGH